MAGNGGGFTNNFISLKTLVERLQYGRDQLTKFWEREIEIVRKAMGFRKSAHVTFDQMSLSDEAAEKNLLIQLADRDIISHETILERFKEIPSVEKMRLKREVKDRDKENLPDKVSPYHKPVEDKEEQPKDSPDKGRPLFKEDEEPRKKRVEKPKSIPGLADFIVWANDAFEEISSISKGYLAVKEKTNMRQLTRSEALELEQIKLHVLTNLEPMKPVTAEDISKVLGSSKNMPNDFKNILIKEKISPEHLTMESYKKRVLATYVEYLRSKK